MSYPIPRKRFGQHFLHDQAIIQHILTVMQAKVGQHWVEIGPGQGALTIPMLKQIKKLEAVELDRDLIEILPGRCSQHGELILHAADALDFDFGGLKQDNQPLHVFGNLPYNISTPLLFHLLTFANTIEDMHFMVQKEVADRLAAAPDTSDYGRLSVMIQYHCRVDWLFDVPPEAFSPPPKVQSSIIRLVPYKELPYPCKNYPLLEQVVKQAFGQRRKTLRNSLKELVSDEQWKMLPVNPQLRAEALGVGDFVRMVNLL